MRYPVEAHIRWLITKYWYCRTHNLPTTARYTLGQIVWAMAGTKEIVLGE